MSFSVGFADEIEKLALRLPSPQEMLGAAATGQVSKGVPQPDLPPPQAPAAAPPQVNVHVHHQAPKSGAGGKKALPKPPQDAPGPIKHSTEPENLSAPPGSDAMGGAPPLMPKAPSFAGGTQKPVHNYSSQMKNYVDEGTGPTKQHYVDLSAPFRDTRRFDAPKTPFTNITMGDVMGGTTSDLRNPMAGLVEGKPAGLSAARGATPLPGKSSPAPGRVPMSAGAQNIEIQPMSSPKKKRMFGTTLASNEGPAKI